MARNPKYSSIWETPLLNQNLNNSSNVIAQSASLPFGSQTPIPSVPLTPFISTSSPVPAAMSIPLHSNGFSTIPPSASAETAPGLPYAANRPPESQGLHQLAISKERELQEMNEMRIKTLEKALAAKDRQIADHANQLIKLKEDFKFNLNLIEERDAELQRYDTTVLAIKASLRQKEAELSEAKIAQAEAEAQRKRVLDRQVEQENYWQSRLKEAHDETETVRWNYEEQLRAIRLELDSTQNKLAHCGRDYSKELDQARREMTKTFDDMMQAREREARKAREALEVQLVEAERKLAQTARTADQLRLADRQCQLKLDQVQSLLETREDRIRVLEWELEDKLRMKDAELEDTRLECDRLSIEVDQQKDKYQKKIDEMVDSLEQVEKAYIHTKSDAQYESQRLHQVQENALKNNRSKYETQLKLLQDQLNTATTSVSDLQDASRKQCADFEDQMTQRQHDWELLETELRAQLSAFADRNSCLELKIAEAERSLTNTQEKVLELRESISEKNKQISRLEQNTSQVQHEAQIQSQALETQVKKLQQDIEQARQRIMELCTEKNELTEEHTNNYKNLQLKTTRYKERIKELEGDLVENIRQMELKQQDLDRANQRAEDLAKTPMPSQSPLLRNGRKATIKVDQACKDSLLFSEDFGIPSPLSSPPFTPVLALPNAQESTEIGFSAQRATSDDMLEREPVEASEVKNLELQNQTLRNVINDMRHEMEALQKALPSPAKSQMTSSAVEKIAKLSEDSQKLKSLNEELQEKLQGAKQHIQKLEKIIEENTQDKKAAGLQEKLNDALMEIVEIAAERDKLMEMSNQLRADQNKVKQQATEHYEKQLFSLQAALNNFVEENNLLKRQLTSSNHMQESEFKDTISANRGQNIFTAGSRNEQNRFKRNTKTGGTGGQKNSAVLSSQEELDKDHNAPETNAPVSQKSKGSAHLRTLASQKKVAERLRKKTQMKQLQQPRVRNYNIKEDG